VTLIDSAKDLLGIGSDEKGTSPPQGRQISGTNSFARIVYFHYNKQNFGLANNIRPTSPDSTIFDVTPGVLEEEIVDLRVSKSMNNPAGQFDVTLLPNRNWKSAISPGDWVLIYLYSNTSDALGFSAAQPPNKNIVMLGNIDRISKSKQRDEQTDKVLVRYHLAGRDFGKVIDETEMWFDPYNVFTKLVKVVGFLIQRGLAFKGNPTDLVNSALDVFLSKSGADLSKTGIGKGRTEPLGQWQIPEELASVFEASFSIPIELGGMPQSFSEESKFFNDILKRKIEEGLPGYKFHHSLTAESNGSVWQFLQRGANNIINDLFFDLHHREDGTSYPTVFLRPHPNSAQFFDPLGGLKSKFKSLQDLQDEFKVDMSATMVKYENLGKDFQTRFNMMWLSPEQSKNKSVINEWANTAGGVIPGIGKPMVQSESIIRYGLKRFKGTMDFVYVDNKATTYVNKQEILFKSFINQTYDHKAYNHLYDTGTIVTIGEKRAQLGSVLRLLPSVENAKVRLYYIEGYTHTWKFPGVWETEWNVTMGQFDDKGRPFIDIPITDFGQPDVELGRGYLAKTNVDRNAIPKPADDAGGLLDKILELF
jgi:hypothetical protein